MATPLAAKEERLTVLNRLLLPLLRAARRYHHVWRLSRSDAARAPAKTVNTSTYTVAIITLELPGSHPLTIAYYVSTQRSRPLSPKQLTQRMRQLKKMLAKNRTPQGDTVYALYIPAGLTRGARRIAHHNMILYSRKPERLAERIASYLRHRYERLLEKLRGRKVWGQLPLLLYSLSTLATELGEHIDNRPSPDWAIEAAEKGGVIT